MDRDDQSRFCPYPGYLLPGCRFTRYQPVALLDPVIHGDDTVQATFQTHDNNAQK